MTHDIKIPENIERAAELSVLMTNVLNVITIERAFLSQLQKEGKLQYHIITLIVDLNNDPLPNEVLSMVSDVAREFPYFRTRIYTENQLEISLERGSVYFLEHCCLGETIFAHPEGENVIDYSETVHKTLIHRANRFHASEMRKIQSFVKTADILIKEGDCAIATFNLHQAFELAFRFIEQMCMGKAKVTHSIISHINYCKSFFPTLWPFPETSKMDNNELLLLLEHAYSVARYGNEFEIDKTQSRAILSEVKAFIKEVDSIFQRHLGYCRERIENNKATDNPVDDTNGGGKCLLDCLKDLEREHLKTLKPYLPEKGLYSIEVITKGYLETSFMVSNLIKVCILALETDYCPDHLIPQPEHNVKEVLGYILDMLPHDEMEFVDEVRNLIDVRKK